jgi:arylsulfatase A-like enzyme
VGPFPVLIVSAWCGLVSGLLEVAAIVLRKRTIDPNHLYELSRHFVWLIPLANLCLFLALGFTLKILMLASPRPGTWLAPRFLCALTLLPPLLAGFPRIHGLAWFVVTLGLAARLVPILERHALKERPFAERIATIGFCRFVRLSLPALAGFVLILAAMLFAADWYKERRQSTRPLPASGSPNLLLIVLDTVAAEHLSLHGYARPTSPTLDELGRRGIRFDSVQATSSWTLPSHASMFTGRWPHELSAGWLTPLDETYPTLAEFLSTHGYATAGFVGNYSYCASDSGLARGFAAYKDYIFPGLSALKPAALVTRPLDGIRTVQRFLANQLGIDLLESAVQRLWLLVHADRKEAVVLNRELLDWLTRRRQPERPFFAFLNYYDAHTPYELPAVRIHRFGTEPNDPRERDMIQSWWSLDKRGLTAQDITFAQNAYDDCVADLDEQLGRLIDDLGRRGLLERTWVIITADHGESFGEHAGVFCHGTSLYQTELHVPLLIIPPGGSSKGRVVAEAVSLRSLAPTIVDVLGLKAGSPFPGASLARFWDASMSAPAADRVLSEVVPIDPLHPEPLEMVKPHWPLAALNERGWSYIRREGDLREELFRVREDARELHNLAASPAARFELARMRASLSELTAGALTPERFRP